MTRRESAKQALVYYFRLIYARTAGTLTPDMAAEIEGIVDDIIQAAVEP